MDIKQPTQQSVMQFDPYSGSHHPWPSHAEQYRETWPHRAWYFNPWTGVLRNDADVKSDSRGYLIVDPQSINT